MARTCELCPAQSQKGATVYCAADACYLCAGCDQEVHTANRLARRHVRRPVEEDELADGSSINDDSDARVPDVSATGTSNKTAVTLGTDASSNDEESKDADLPPLNDVSVTFEDAAEYDFCFDTIGTRMPLLIAGDDDTLFSDGKLGKNFYSEVSWDSVVSDAFEHVVPDVEGAVRKDVDGKVIASWDALKGRVTSHTAPHVRHVKGESVKLTQLDMELSLDCQLNDLMSDHPSCDVTSPVTPSSKVKKEEDVLDKASKTEAPAVVPKEEPEEAQMTDVKMETKEDTPNSSPNTQVETNSEMKEKDAAKACTEADENEAKLQEQRKKRRMEALARFRNKRANRSFTKKVRYECRKQLADSRPRVKGRFVRKVEMALFRKYGALYRDHLDELDSITPEQCVSSV